MTIKDIKKEIKRVRRLKLQCKSGSPERIALHRKIKELQAQLQSANVIDNDKAPLIEELYRLDPLFKTLDMDLTKFTVKQLAHHLKRLKEKKLK